MSKNHPILLLTFLFFVVSSSRATTYYVKAGGGNTTSGLSDASAWNYAALSGKSLVAGDTVLFRRGDTFFGELPVMSGRKLKPVHYGAYGTGANPVISGFITINAWTRFSGSIFYADLTAYKLATLNLVCLNGKAEAMGRYPNRGYLPYTKHSGNTSITGAAIGVLPFNAAGGEAVIRKVRWILDRQPVSAHSSNTLTLGTTSPYGGSLGYEAVDNNGFFIQNHIRTLDTEGEWFYDAATRRLYMVLSNASTSVKVSVKDWLVYLSSKSNISFADLDFEGSNTHGISMHGTSEVAFTNCRFYRHGQTALYGNSVSGISIRGGSVEDCLNNGIWIEWAGSNIKVEGVGVNNIGTLPGAGRSGDGAQQGIAVYGNNTTIRNCIVTNIGYNGIKFNGNDALIENNLVDRFCTVKDDGGGIYTYENDGVTVRNRVVRNNIVLNAIGTFAGAESYYYEKYGKAAAIYLDGNSNHTEVTNNVLAHGPWAGVLVNNNSWNQITGNLIYNHEASVMLLESRAGNIRNTTVTGNECVAKGPKQKALHIKLYEADHPALLGTFNHNFYARPLDDTKTITLDRQYAGNGTTQLTLAEWQSGYGMDVLSGKSAIGVDDENKILFDYNYSPSAKIISLTGEWKDIYSTLYQSSYTIPSYRGKVFLRTTALTANPSLPLKEASFAAVLTGNVVTLNWTGYSDAASTYELERSATGADFARIAVVNGTGGASETYYQHIDRQPLSPVNYYRLRVVESNGSVSYSKVLTVRVARAGFSFQAFPNPATSVLQVRLAEQAAALRLRVVDLSGRTVKEVQFGAGRAPLQYSLDVSGLPRGNYLLTVNNETLQFGKL